MLQLYTPLRTTGLKSWNLFEEVLQRVLRSLTFVCYTLVKQVSTEPLHFRDLVQDYFLEMHELGEGEEFFQIN